MHNRIPTERENGIKNVFKEIMAENFTNLKKETDTQVQEAQRVPNKMNPNRPTPSHKAISWLLYRNTAGQKGVARYIQSPEREKPALPSKITI